MAFKTYCWSLGTTSFRTKKLTYSIEKQLQYLKEFWKINSNVVWTGNSDIQTAYYDLLKDDGFISGDAGNKPKDARQKTSGLVEIGLLNKDRKITEIGNRILEISKNNDFNKSNIFNIPNDAYHFLLQLLKLQFTNQDFEAKPYLFLVYLLEKLDFLTYGEFTYLVPMCKNKEELFALEEMLLNFREDVDYNGFIIEKLMNMDNYQEALNHFRSAEEIDQHIFEIVGLNRDGGHHDKPYFNAYYNLFELYKINNKSFEERKELYQELWNSLSLLSSTVSGSWKKYLFFGFRNFNSIDEEFDSQFKFLDICQTDNEESFRTIFFKRMHLYKCKSTLSDYSDLNRRYLSLTETIKFGEHQLELELIPKYFFQEIIENLLNEDLISNSEYKTYMENYIELVNISNLYNETKESLIDRINIDLNEDLTVEGLETYLADKKMAEFRRLINNKFNDKFLLEIITKIERREDNNIMDLVSDNADIPTIFEYILGIIWYKVSGYRGNLLNYMKLSLDNNLLPKTHAGGGIADIEYKYNSDKNYNEHTLLLEATLSDSTNQRSMEMEPVSRHLGESIKTTNNFDNYAIFVAPKLDERLILDFRNMKTRLYPFDKNHSTSGLNKINNEQNKYIDGLKIIPITTGIIKRIIENKIEYDSLYDIFKSAYESTVADENWYNDAILEKFM